jgi:hypothetical protein
MFGRTLAACALVTLFACDDDDDARTEPGPLPGVDAAAPEADAAEPPAAIDAGPPQPTGMGITGAACARNADCLGGTCLGVAGGLEEGNNRFVGGYCTTLGCQAESQDGCGPDEWCIDGGFSTYCVELCSKADGVTCERADHVCLGLGTWGGCFSNATVECDAVARTGCEPDELCVRIGFEDRTLGRCEPLCDPMNPSCPSGDACYYIRRYNTAFCGDPGSTPPEEPCTCDKCCVPGYACAPDLDGAGKHCRPYCVVGGAGCPGGQCVAIEPGSPWGGCVTAGSAGT